VEILPKSTAEPKSSNWLLSRNTSNFLKLSMTAKTHPFLDLGSPELVAVRSGEDKLWKESHERAVRDLLFFSAAAASVIKGWWEKHAPYYFKSFHCQ